MTAFVYDDGLNRLYLDNKKVHAAFQQPAFRDGLKYLNDLYKEGLIARDSFSFSDGDVRRTNSQKYESVIGAIPAEHQAGPGTREAGQPVRWVDYEPIPPLKGPAGQIARYDPYLKFRITQIGSMVPVTCKNPALIARWLDFWHTEEGARIASLGGEGITWAVSDPGSIGVDGKPAVYKIFPSLKQGDRWYNKNAWGGMLISFRQAGFWGNQQAFDPFAPDGSGGEAFLYRITEKNYVPYGHAELVVPPLWYSADDASEMALLTTNINTYVEESIAKFIIGDLDPDRDADWNNFQTQLKNLGIDKYLQIIQKTYDASAFAK
jgi:putative aldouronate transport system substrate-binding protein